MSKNSAVMVISLVCALWVSCTAQINGSIMDDGRADMQFYAALEPKMAALLRALAAVSGNALAADSPLLDAPGIAASMSSAPGIESISLINLTPDKIVGPVKISKIGDFLSLRTVQGKTHGAKSVGFINYEQGIASNRGRCTISLSLESGPEILALISPDISDYLSAILAPVATGEVMTKAQYLLMVEQFYGKDIAGEIAQAIIHVSIDFPGQVQSVKGGVFTGRRAEFTVPLVDVLVLEKPLSWEVAW